MFSPLFGFCGGYGPLGVGIAAVWAARGFWPKSRGPRLAAQAAAATPPEPRLTTTTTCNPLYLGDLEVEGKLALRHFNNNQPKNQRIQRMSDDEERMDEATRVRRRSDSGTWRLWEINSKDWCNKSLVATFFDLVEEAAHCKLYWDHGRRR